MEILIHAFIILFLAYCLIGLIVGVAFVVKGVKKVDPVSANSGLAFRLLILPGSIALWPVLLRKWISKSKS